MGKKLYVGNIPFSATEEGLNQAFSQCGAVESVKIITDRISGRSKGFAFVEMVNDNDAATAISKLNGTELDGRTLTVNEARPMVPRESRGDRGGFGGGGGFNRGPRDRNRSPRGGYGRQGRF